MEYMDWCPEKIIHKKGDISWKTKQNISALSASQKNMTGNLYVNALIVAVSIAIILFLNSAFS